ncbi:PhnD/SsuA/transferrin family substrate-binding protein [Parapusillimonas granuli]|uniref:PhnD/SsuA/transferrin family substrate-binding protein n=1 Tax=Parapusillimonas granuli TaxID=380911 RepID=A0A853G7K5_9BURK|nr:PhnD/SsuA/transferrin family substrate-binding protein [Parapusillimonas granuli]MBB5217268.1 diguanylate cyclase (GGDEF)-like protein/PAS domain S-box-containing protein [Parapusillimonas granuli]MEB2399281.1 PhnD/SsuA/transferrin family substrate-binding protein [Alcaligenaceae bacterium]NYT50940.1 PhnD/SsuA/transferrin family substrate-binding protein [Parapusillimonas granuli]
MFSIAGRERAMAVSRPPVPKKLGGFIGTTTLGHLCRLVLFNCLFLLQAQAATPDTLTIGMLSYRPVPVHQSSWGGFADYLEKRLPGTRVRLQFLDLDEMAAALDKNELDLVFTNPVHYVQLRTRNEISGTIATLVGLDGGRPVPHVSGLVVRRKERSDLQRWEDLRGKVVAVSGTQYLGGYAAQAKELTERGIALESIVFKQIGHPQDRVVAAVLSGEADAGFVRSGVLESMVQSGEADAGDLAVVEPVSHPAFPFMSSTPLYPEWPMVALSHLDRDTSRRISAALLALEPNDVLSQSASIHGFVIPSDYQSVKEAMIAARMPPFDQLRSIALREFAREHALSGAALAAMLLTLLFAAAWIARANRRLARTQSRLTHELQRLDNVIKGSNSGTWELHFPEGKLLFDARWAEMLGYTLAELPPGSLDTWQNLIHPSDKEQVRDALDALRAPGSDSFETEFRMLRKNGSWGWISCHGSVVVRAKDGAPLLLTGMNLDVSEKKRLEEQLKLSHAVFLQTHAGVIITDHSNQIVQVNPAFTDITGYTRDEILGKSPSFLSSGYHDKAFYKKLWSTLKKTGKWAGEVVNRHKNGHTFIERISIVELRDRDGKVTHHIAIFTDISLQKRLIAGLQHSANHDMLTGLPNRNLLHDRINLATAHARRSRTGVAIIFLDLDGFKPVNDTHGHAAGDVLLKKIGARMKGLVREGDTAARVGGDEFVLVLNDIVAREDAVKYAEKVLAAINEPAYLENVSRTVQVSASLGVLICPHATLNAFCASPECLLDLADMLMYQAKHAGRARLAVRELGIEDLQQRKKCA